MSQERPFWERKSLSQMTATEWESLCDGCAQCCLHVFEDEDGGGFLQVPVACRLLDVSTCRCTDYANRADEVPSCIVLTPQTVGDYPWLPETCAYRCLDEGRELPSWHHLRSGSDSVPGEGVHAAGVSVADKVVSERDADPMDALAALLDEAAVDAKRGKP